MQYHVMDNTGERVSVLGFGIMRLLRDPEYPGWINREAAAFFVAG